MSWNTLFLQKILTEEKAKSFSVALKRFIAALTYFRCLGGGGETLFECLYLNKLHDNDNELTKS